MGNENAILREDTLSIYQNDIACTLIEAIGGVSNHPLIFVS